MRIHPLSLVALAIGAVQPVNGILCFLFGIDCFQNQIDDLKRQIDSLMGPQSTRDFDDDTSLGVEDALTGLILRDLDGLRIMPPATSRRRTEDGLVGPLISFGPTDDCKIGTLDGGGVGIVDPKGLTVKDAGADTATINFGKVGECRIVGTPQGLIFEDPNGFDFRGGDIKKDGSIIHSGTGTPSSKRFKRNIQTMKDALEKIRQLRGVYFDWDEDHEGGKADLGVIAEEVAQVFPQVVLFEQDGTTPRAVKYDNLVAVALQGINIQQDMIKDQQNMINDLQMQVKQQKEQLENVFKRLDQLTSQNTPLQA